MDAKEGELLQLVYDIYCKLETTHDKHTSDSGSVLRPILMEFDSLFLHILKYKSIQDSLVFQGESIHVVYIMEKILQFWVQQQRSVTIIIIEAFGELWVYNAVLALMREILIKHLLFAFKSSTNINILNISGAYFQAINKLSDPLNTILPSFCIIQPSQSSWLRKNMLSEPLRRIVGSIQLLTIHLLIHNIPCITYEEIVCHRQIISGTRLHLSTTSKSLLSKLNHLVYRTGDSSTQNVTYPSEPVFKIDTNTTLQPNVKIILDACILLYKRGLTDFNSLDIIQFTKIIFLHSLLLIWLPLNMRVFSNQSLSIQSKDISQNCILSAERFICIYRELSIDIVKVLSKIADIPPKICDLLSGRLSHMVLFRLQKLHSTCQLFSTGFTIEQTQILQQHWDYFLKGVQLEGSPNSPNQFFPIVNDDMNQQANITLNVSSIFTTTNNNNSISSSNGAESKQQSLKDCPDSWVDLVDEKESVTRVNSNDIKNDLIAMKGCLLLLYENEEKQLAPFLKQVTDKGETNELLFDPHLKFFELRHWHNHKLLSDDIEQDNSTKYDNNNSSSNNNNNNHVNPDKTSSNHGLDEEGEDKSTTFRLQPKIAPIKLPRYCLEGAISEILNRQYYQNWVPKAKQSSNSPPLTKQQIAESTWYQRYLLKQIEPEMVLKYFQYRDNIHKSKQQEIHKAKLANYTQKASESLQTSTKRILRDIVETNLIDSNEIKTGVQVTPSKKKPTKKELIQQSIQQQRAAKNMQQELDRVRHIIEKLESESQSKSPYIALEFKISTLDEKLLDHEERFSALFGLTQLIQWQRKLWKLECHKEPNPIKRKYTIAAQLFQCLHDIFQRFLDILDTSQLHHLLKSAALLGFQDTVKDIAHNYLKYHAKHSVKDKRKNESSLTLTTLKLEQYTSPSTYSVGLHRARFQLRHAGHLMLRNVQSQRDPRVNSYFPDKWQRDLMDCIDRNESVLVVGPTSSGKTIVSFYAMEKVHELNKSKTYDKSIIVYVAPTQALVNQTAADLSSRSLGRVTIFTRENKPTSMEMEILVTVPQCLEIIFNSPTRQAWLTQVKYIVFDEVHLIAQADVGSIWERLLLCLPREIAFIACSATIGKPKQFHNWLQSISDRKVNFVGDDGDANNPNRILRWSHLNTFVYFPQQSALIYLHPMCTLNSRCAPADKVDFKTLKHEWNALESFPPVELSTADCLNLYDQLFQTSSTTLGFPSELLHELQQLSPEIYFPEMYITKIRAAQFELSLKTVMLKWMKFQNNSICQQVLYQAWWNLGTAYYAAREQNSGKQQTLEEILHQSFQLIRELHSKDFLPTIAYLLDRDAISILTEFIIEQLEEEELKEFQCSDPIRYNKKINREKFYAEVETQREQIRIELEEAQALLQRNPEIYAYEMRIKELEMELAQCNTDWDDVDPRFCFVSSNERLRLGSKDIQFWLSRIRIPRDDPLMRGLQRGIGAHHAGLPKAYRDLVETLFRQGKLRVIIASGTLAMGINAPARSVVFLQDSTYLDAVTFHQMRGRAGRRGFDNEGQVVFFRFQHSRICELMSAQVPTLTGTHIMDTNIVLKLSILLHQTPSQYQSQLINTHKQLLRKPLKAHSLSLNGVQWNEIEISCVQHHFRASFQLLNDLNLLNSDGLAVGYAGLVSHLSYHGTPALVLGYLFGQQAFNPICEKFESDPKTVIRNLMGILSHLFHRYPALATEPLLPHLDGLDNSGSIKMQLNQFNKIVITSFTSHLATFIRSQRLQPQNKCTLPLSLLEFQESNFDPHVLDNKSSKNLIDSIISVNTLTSRLGILQSPMVAVSGFDGDFTNAQELCLNLREGIKLEVSAVPTWNWTNSRGKSLKLNSYALDFLKHSQYQALNTDNHIPDGTLWHLLQDWLLTLMKISASLELYYAEMHLQVKKFKMNNKQKLYEGGMQFLTKFEPVRKSFRALSTKFAENFHTIPSRY